MQAKLNDAEVAAKNAAEKARKASAYAAPWLFISLLIAAFVASLAATCGDRRREVSHHLNTEAAMRSLILLFLGIPIIILSASLVR
ncbi:MAG: hypothetical protein NTY41_11385 [Proteobacteria bacterium]|nr:hypothetical protein [Pseudomonadota bacterium]